MHPFTFSPWVWRNPAVLPGGPGRVGLFQKEEPRPDEERRSTETGPSAEGTAGRTDRDGGTDLTGYKVEAADGGIGSIDEATYDVGSACLVVDTGPWIFGRKVLLPAGTVHRIDHHERVAYVDRTKDQIKGSPEYDEETFGTPVYRDRVGAYYADSYRTAPGQR